MLRDDQSVNSAVEQRPDNLLKEGSGRVLKESSDSLFARLSPLQRSLISALAGFVFYGVWAFWVNHQHGSVLALKAGCVQGSYSFALTLCMTMLLEAIFRFNSRVFNQQHLINWLTVTICCALVFTGSWVINVVAETPEIFRTVILGYIMGSIYSILYVRGLAKAID